MKQTKKTLVTAVALTACVGTQLFAQNAKEGVITFALTGQAQSSVSTSSSTANAGVWSAPPQYYKTASKKVATTDILRDIAFVVHGNPAFYSSQASLVLVQGELSGFFNLTPELAASAAPPRVDKGAATTLGHTGVNYGMSVVRLSTGRHFEEDPNGWPPGHHQPWGQIFVKDPAKSLCENVTFFFAITVEECYDCFYLNSFISDAKFTFKPGTQSGPPCCTVPESLTGSGKDRYYMTLSFDNTLNNPYLNPNSAAYVGFTPAAGDPANPYVGIKAADRASDPADGLIPDLFKYVDPIRSGLGVFNPYVMRFTLNGILTYTWTLKFINNGDVFPDFIGSAAYAANGYGFIGLYCTLLTGTANIAEKSLKAGSCCLDLPWYDSWYATGWNQAQTPWNDFFKSPINTPVDLSSHMGFDRQYGVGDQWGTNPKADTKLDTPLNDTQGSTYVPVGP